MAQEILKPLSLYDSINATMGFNVIADMSDDPNSFTSENSSVYSLDKTKPWSIDFVMNNPSGMIQGDVKIRLRAQLSNFLAIVNPSVLVYVDNIEVYNDNEAIIFQSAPTYHEAIFPASLIGDLTGKELRIRFYGGFDDNGTSHYSTLYAIDMLVNVQETVTVVNPDIPTNLLPTDNFTTTTPSVSFSATLNDAEDVVVDDSVSLVVEYSQDQTFATGVTTKVSNNVSPSDTVTVSSNTLNNGIWYWRAFARDEGGLTSAHTSIRSFIIDNSSPTITSMTPANNIVVTSASQTLSVIAYDANDDSVSVEFQVADNLSFTSSTTYVTALASSGTLFYKSSLTLSLGNNYWRARAKDSHGKYSSWSSPYGIFLDAPAIGRFAPNTILVQTNLTGATLANLSDDPDSPDTTFATATSNTSVVSLRTGFQTPTRALKIGTGLQEFKVWVKRSNASSASIPTATLKLFESGVEKYASTATSVDTSTGMIISFTWDASLITNIADVELQIDGTVAGNGGSRTTVSIGAVEWNYTLTDLTQTPAPTDVQPSNITGLSSTELTSNSITLSWTNPVDSDFSHVEIHRDNVLIKNNHTLTSYTDYSLSQNTFYTYKIVAVDVTGNKASGITTTATTLTGGSSNFPTVTVINISKTKISDEVEMNQSIITVQFDKDVTQYVARLNGVDYNTGVLVHSGGAVLANTDATVIIDWNELTSEGQNKIYIYGQNADGWTPPS